MTTLLNIPSRASRCLQRLGFLYGFIYVLLAMQTGVGFRFTVDQIVTDSEVLGEGIVAAINNSINSLGDKGASLTGFPPLHVPQLLSGSAGDAHSDRHPDELPAGMQETVSKVALEVHQKSVGGDDHHSMLECTGNIVKGFISSYKSLENQPGTLATFVLLIGILVCLSSIVFLVAHSFFEGCLTSCRSRAMLSSYSDLWNRPRSTSGS